MFMINHMDTTEKLRQQLERIFEREFMTKAFSTPVVYVDKDNNVTMEEKNMTNATYTFKDDFLAPTLSAEGIKLAINACYGGAVYKGEAKLEKPEKKIEAKPVEEKWVWVSGYKGLDKDMKAYGDFQYEMYKLYIMPDGEPVEACHGGFHLCMKLEDLYGYKSIGSGNRFFECSALVRESDLEKYGKCDPTNYYGIAFGGRKNDKLAAKSILLVRELSIDEILVHIEGVDEWPEYVKEMAIAEDIDAAKKELKIIAMVKMGYARPLVEYIVNTRRSYR